jgi:CMP-N,N'-diacetyllegionaminic acid synthase
MSVRLLIIVPARGGSKRVPRKNLLNLAGETLLGRVAACVKEADLGADVVLTTDDEAIATEGRRLAWQVPFLRPHHLATDTADTNSVILHLLDWRMQNGYPDPQLIMILQPTSPFRSGQTLVEAMKLIESRNDVDSVIGVSRIDRPARGIFLADESGVIQSLHPNDDRTPVYIANGALFLAKTSAFRDEGSLYAGRIAALAMDDRQSIDIDTPQDLAAAIALANIGIQPEVELAPASRNHGNANR